MTIPSLSKVKETLTGSKAGTSALIMAMMTFLYPAENQIGESPQPEIQAPIETVIGEEEEILANGETLITTHKVRRKMEEMPQVVDMQEKVKTAANHTNQLAEIISSFLLEAAEKPLQTVFLAVIVIWLRLTQPLKKQAPEETATKKENKE